jgi:DNA-binding transcriptional regulator YiaG
MKGGHAMSNVAKVLKDEISRISRKETKSAVGPIGKSHRGLKKIVADLKRRVVLLEKENKRLVTAMKKHRAEPPQILSEETKKPRLTSKGIRSLRSKLRLTQSDFAKLLGTTAHSVYLWERKEGALKLRGKTRAALLSIRSLGAREAKTRLAEAEAKSKRMRASAPKKRRRKMRR